MAKNNSSNNQFTNNAVGYTLGGGTTNRNLTIAGNSDLTLTQSGTTATNYTLSSAIATDQPVLSSTYNAAGALLVGSSGSAAGTSQPSVLAPGTNGQYLKSTGTSISWANIQTEPVWSGVSSATTIVSNNSYFVTSGSVTFTLPATSAVGDLVNISVGRGIGFTIAQLALQSIQFGSVSTTVGTGGSLTSTAIGDTVQMVCIVANTTWLIIGSIGNITVV